MMFTKQQVEKVTQVIRAHRFNTMQSDDIARAVLSEIEPEWMVQPDRAALVEALNEIARQKLPSEMDEEELECADWEGGYEACVTVALKALSAKPDAQQAPDKPGWLKHGKAIGAAIAGEKNTSDGGKAFDEAMAKIDARNANDIIAAHERQIELLRAQIAADYLLPAQPQPDNAALPEEPTHEMLEAMWNAMFEEPYNCTRAPVIGAAYDALRNALAATAQEKK